MQSLIELPRALAVIALFAAAYVAAAWHLARRAGSRWLIGAWMTGTLLFSIAIIARLRFLGSPVSVPPRTEGDWILVGGSLGIGLVGLGLSTLSVRRGLERSPDGRLTLGRTISGVGAFFGGFLLLFLVLLVGDFLNVGH